MILYNFILFSNVLLSGVCLQRVEAVDPALRRSGRFDAEIEVTTPTEDERFQILKVSDFFPIIIWNMQLLFQ